MKLILKLYIDCISSIGSKVLIGLSESSVVEIPFSYQYLLKGILIFGLYHMGVSEITSLSNAALLSHRCLILVIKPFHNIFVSKRSGTYTKEYSNSKSLGNMIYLLSEHTLFSTSLIDQFCLKKRI